MPALIQRSFSAGEITPALQARADFSKHASALRTCRNFKIKKTGGAENRSGSEFMGEVKDSTKQVRLIPFIFNTSQTYVLEFGNLYIRVLRDSSYIYDLTLTITGVSQANPGVLTYTGSDPSNGDEVYISGVAGMTQLNGRNFKVANVNAGANTFQLTDMAGNNVNTTSYTAYSSGGTAQRVYTITTTYTEAELPAIQYIQSADTVYLVHPSHAPATLSRSGHASWTLADITFGPSLGQVTNVATDQIPAAAGNVLQWYLIYAVDANGIESDDYQTEASALSSYSDTTASGGTNVTVTWTAVANAYEYNIYKAIGVNTKITPYYLTTVGGGVTSFVDAGAITPDRTRKQLGTVGTFAATDSYPSVVNLINQRLALAATNAEIETVYGSKVGDYYNMTYGRPTASDSDAYSFTLAGREVNKIKHIVDLNNMVLLTGSGEFACYGNSAGIVTPTEVNAKQFSYYGSSDLSPIVIGHQALYVQEFGNVVRNLFYNYEVNGYDSDDLSQLAYHLFEGYTIDDWAYQKTPYPVVWAVRSDGVLLGFTYDPKEQVLAWHRHDTDGLIENVCVVPEGTEHVPYIVVKRTINSQTVRYVERMSSRLIDDIVDVKIMDSFLSYDGRNTTAVTMTLSGGTTWADDELIVCTASSATFTTASIGKAVHITSATGVKVKCTIMEYVSTTVVNVLPHITVPTNLRSTARTTWSLAVSQVSGLWHLEGETVAVFADGYVKASPNNSDYTTANVSNGIVTLSDNYAVIHIGLPYISDLETLAIDSPQSETMADKAKLVSKVSMHVEKTRGVFVGTEEPTGDDPLDGLYELKLRNSEGYSEPTELKTEVVDVETQAHWNMNGRVFIRQVDPLPVTILSVIPTGFMPMMRG